ncbi:MAG: dephospho-CoA kinase [Bacteroidales bacterium]|nr:dephospho-CoA kinase [Bacteroidales bacterium]
MKILVITGGIGSGKSEVCRILAQKGLTVQYNADAKVKELYDTVPGLLESIEDRLGCCLRDEAGKFVPRCLAQRIFVDRQALETVESLVFPALMEDFLAFAGNSGSPFVVFESATILEKPQFDGFGDRVILVDAPVSMRMERACRRDGADREAVKARMANQKKMNALSEGATDPRIDAVIVNDGSIAILEQKIEIMMSDLFGDWRKDIV